MKDMAIGEFKAHALQAVAQVTQGKESMLLTKHEKPLAEASPFRGGDDRPVPGKLATAITFKKDILTPLGESEWNVCQ